MIEHVLLKVLLLALAVFSAVDGAATKNLGSASGTGSGNGVGKNTCAGKKIVGDFCDKADGVTGVCNWHWDFWEVPGHKMCFAWCGTPNQYPHSSIVGTHDENNRTSQIEGMNRTYVCDEGYGSAPGSNFTVYCGLHGWSTPLFECKRKCGLITDTNNPYPNATPLDPYGILANDTATLVCKEGYTAVGSMLAICDEKTGEWKKHPKAIDGECVQNCNPPPEDLYTNAYPATSTSLLIEGTVVLYDCAEDHSSPHCPLGAKCTGGSWEKPDATVDGCEYDCGPLAESGLAMPLNAYPSSTPDDTRVGAVYIFTCNSGYYNFPGEGETEGEPITFECTAPGSDGFTGGWFLSGGKCEQACEDLQRTWFGPSTPASTPEYAKEDETVAFTCDSPYVLVGDAQMATCKNGRWGYSGGECKRVCAKPGDIFENGILDEDNYSAPAVEGSDVTFSCDAGYEGGGSATCNSDGDWTVRGECDQSDDQWTTTEPLETTTTDEPVLTCDEADIPEFISATRVLNADGSATIACGSTATQYSGESWTLQCDTTTGEFVLPDGFPEEDDRDCLSIDRPCETDYGTDKKDDNKFGGYKDWCFFPAEETNKFAGHVTNCKQSSQYATLAYPHDDRMRRWLADFIEAKTIYKAFLNVRYIKNTKTWIAGQGDIPFILSPNLDGLENTSPKSNRYCFLTKKTATGSPPAGTWTCVTKDKRQKAICMMPRSAPTTTP